MRARILFFILSFMLSSWAWGMVSSSANPQGEIWRLRESGKLEEALKLERNLTQILLMASIDQLSVLGTGISESYLVQLPDNIYGVLKASDPDPRFKNTFLNEIAAYRLDQVLELNMVPLTVVREIQGKYYSLQLYYPSWYERGSNAVLIKNDVFRRQADLAIFDYILMNGDRHLKAYGHNTVIGSDGRLVAIDHARSFTPTKLAIPMVSDISYELRQKLLTVKGAEIEAAVAEFMPLENFISLIGRVKLMRKMLTIVGSESERFVQATPGATVRSEYTQPFDVEDLKFFNALAVKDLFEKQSGHTLTPKALEYLNTSRTPQEIHFVGMIVIKNWDKYKTGVKRQLTERVVTTGLALMIEKKYFEIGQEMKKIAPEHARRVGIVGYVGTIPMGTAAPICGKIFSH